MYIKKHTSHLLSMVSYSHRDKDLELEVLVKNPQNNKINSDMFSNTIKRLKGSKGINYDKEEEILDIIVNDIRFSVIGKENIVEYCETDDIKTINEKNLIIMKKNSVKKTDINEYRIRFNLKRETILTKSNAEVSSIMKKWNSYDKIFRYKKRISFITTDKRFQFDLTILKSSNKKTIKDDETKLRKSDVKDYMRKYVISPEYIAGKTAFNEWFDGLKDSDKVTMMGRKQEVPMPSKSVKKSNVFNNELEYEIEIEYLGNKMKVKQSDKAVLVQMLQNLIIVLQSIQKSYYIISEFEKNQVIGKYKKIMGDHRFSAPMNVTLEKKHVLERKYEDYKGMVSIRKGYSVTDKADGERNLLLVIDNGNMYLINRKNDVKYIGAKCLELANSIFDCEYILKDKDKNNINLLMIFDAYFFSGEDIRKRILNRSNEEINENKIDKSRYEYVNEAIDIISERLIKDSNNNLEISKKKFYFGDDEFYSKSVEEEIDEKEVDLRMEEEGTDDYIEILNEIAELKADTKIFSECSKVYKKDYIYDIDGLIFTPRNLFVGEEPGKTQKNMFSGRWYRSFKWKPPEQNTIDFFVEFLKDPKDESVDLIKYNDYKGTITPYKTMVLNIGYDPTIHTKHNSCRILNENLTFEPGYNNSPFMPTEPYIKDIHYSPVPLDLNGNMYTLDDKNIIEENMIIECIYEPNSDTIFKWKPMRVRDNLNPNDFVTATNVWNCIHDPVTLDMITTGKIDTGDEFNLYYDRIMKRSLRKGGPMYDYHSFVKKQLIVNNTLNSKNMLDTSVGKGGDLNHWIDAEVNMFVGVDISKHGLNDSSNGACNRILNKMSEMDTTHIGENYMMIWGNTSKNILDGSAGGDELNKYYLDIIYGNIPMSQVKNGKLRNFYNLGNSEIKDGGFDVVSCQFSIHYYFKTPEMINIYLNNVSKSLKQGGRFIGTCLNGEAVFEALKKTDTISNEGDTLIWKITKKYNQSKFSSTDTSLGMEIGVYNESIGTTFNEYLTNMDYLTKTCSKYGLKLIENASFENLFTSVSDAKKYGRVKEMDDEMKLYSFLNNYFVYEKTF